MMSYGVRLAVHGAAIAAPDRMRSGPVLAQKMGSEWVILCPLRLGWSACGA